MKVLIAGVVFSCGGLAAGFVSPALPPPQACGGLCGGSGCSCGESDGCNVGDTGKCNREPKPVPTPAPGPTPTPKAACCGK